jgi:hypothetical protein
MKSTNGYSKKQAKSIINSRKELFQQKNKHLFWIHRLRKHSTSVLSAKKKLGSKPMKTHFKIVNGKKMQTLQLRTYF